MVATVPMATRKVKDYRTCVGYDTIHGITDLATPLRGGRILHLSTTPSRPELSGTLSTLTSLLQNVGLRAEWRVIRTNRQRNDLDQALSKALNGQFVRLAPEASEAAVSQHDDILPISARDYDFIVVHDMELAGTISNVERSGSRAKWIWHCHSDISKTQPDVWNHLMRRTLQYDHRIISSLDAVPTNSYHSCSTVPPTIDPLNLRNRDLPQKFVDAILRNYGLNFRLPMILSLLHGDPDCRDAARIIEAFAIAKDQMPSLQLLLLMANDSDGQQAMRHQQYVQQKLGHCDGIYVYPMPEGIGNISINAFQRAAAVVVEGSQDQELATILLESMWKARPVVVSEATANQLGIEDGRNGYVPSSTREMGQQMVRMVESRMTAGIIGEAATEHVRTNFMITRLMEAYLNLLQELSGRNAVREQRLVAAR